MTRFAGPLAIAAAFVAMLIWSWGTWLDVQVDFGRELYIPWQIVEGRVLYRDIVSFFGPLSSYWNAAWFAVFGVSLRTLVVANALIAAATVGMLYLLLHQIGSRLSATTGCLAFIAIFGFGQFMEIANFNFICPYSHEMTHGAALSIAALLCMTRYADRRLPRFVAAAGVCWGATFLTKPEIFAALTAGILAFSIAMAAMCQPGTRARLIRPMLLFTGMGAAVALSALALLWTAMPMGLALTGVLGSWPYLRNPEVFQMPFHRHSMGLANVPVSIGLMATAIGWYALAFAPIATAALFARRNRISRRSRAIIATASIGGVALFFYLTFGGNGWFQTARPFPVFMLLLCGWFGATIIRRRRTGVDARLAARFALAVFSLALLGKMMLNARFHHYGFVLAMPAAMILVAALIDWIPHWLEGWGGSGNVFRAGAVGLMACVAATYLIRAQQMWARKPEQIGAGGDAFRVGLRGVCAQHTLHWLQGAMQPGESFVVVPEGVMLNFLARVPNPTPHWSFLPFELALFGEHAALQSLRDHSPTYVVLVHRSIAEYSESPYGVKYGAEILQWVHDHYQQVYLIEDPPFEPDSIFGIAVFKRVASP